MTRGAMMRSPHLVGPARKPVNKAPTVLRTDPASVDRNIPALMFLAVPSAPRQERMHLDRRERPPAESSAPCSGEKIADFDEDGRADNLEDPEATLSTSGVPLARRKHQLPIRAILIGNPRNSPEPAMKGKRPHPSGARTSLGETEAIPERQNVADAGLPARFRADQDQVATCSAPRSRRPATRRCTTAHRPMIAARHLSLIPITRDPSSAGRNSRGGAAVHGRFTIVPWTKS